MKYLVGLLFILLLVAALYYFIPLVRYSLIPLTGGTQEPQAEDDIFPKGSYWINSEPLRMKKLQQEGKYILIDFWTYTCINCIRANPHTQELWERYKDHGLVIVGVHTPEFISIEADPKNIERAVKKAGYTYPIIVDSDRTIWNTFGNRFWPAKYLINPQGKIIHFQYGEGNYDTEEQKIRDVLSKAGHTLPTFTDTREFLTPISKKQTPELYAGLGFIRKPYGNTQQPDRNMAVEFTLPSTLGPDQIYLEGSWQGAHDFVESLSVGKIVLTYLANTPYIVLSPVGVSPVGDAVTVEVLLDGAPLPKELQGEDIQVRGSSTVMVVDEPRLYYPVSSQAPYGRATITFITAAGLRLFAFTFGSYETSKKKGDH